MLVFVNLFVLEVIVAPELGVASSHGVGGFQQIVAKETVARFDKSCVLGLKIAGLVLRPDEAGELGNGGLGLETVDVADFGDDAGGIDLADAGDGYKRVGNDFKLLLNSLVQDFDLAVQSPHGCDRDRHSLIYGIVHGLG